MAVDTRGERRLELLFVVGSSKRGIAGENSTSNGTDERTNERTNERECSQEVAVAPHHRCVAQRPAIAENQAPSQLAQHYPLRLGPPRLPPVQQLRTEQRNPGSFNLHRPKDPREIPSATTTMPKSHPTT